MGDEEGLPEEDFDDEENVNRYDPLITLKSLLRQIYCCSGALLLPLFAAVLEQGVYKNYGFAKETYELIYIFGEVVGFIFGGIFISTYGRKLALIISNLSFLLLTLVAFASFDNQLLFLPIVMGILFRFSTMAFIFYVAEISDITFRALFFGSYFPTHYFGHYLILYMKPVTNPIGAAAVLAFISLLISLFVPETPYYLASKGDLERAEDIFTWIRVGERDIFEYDLMLDKVQKSEELGGILKVISSSTFIVCMIMCILLKTCNFSTCELYQSTLKYFYMIILGSGDYDVYYNSIEMNLWTVNTPKMIVGGLVFICISFVIPRKIIYGIGFVFTLLHVLPVFLMARNTDFIIELYPYCHFISYGGREPLTFLLPVEIFPATIRNGGLIIVFIFEKLIQVVGFYSTELSLRKWYYMFKRAGKDWIFYSYYASLIGVPFLLIFMPETKGKSLFEVEDVGLSLGDISELQMTEESIVE